MSSGSKSSQAENSRSGTNLLEVRAWKSVGLAVLFLALAAVLSPVSQYNLSPVYGSIPSAVYHSRGIWLVTVLAFIAKRPLARVFTFEARQILPVVGFNLSPIQYFLCDFSSDLGPNWGPLLTECATYYPLLFFASLAASYALDDLGLENYGYVLADGIPALMSFAVITVVQKGANEVLPQLMGTADFFTRSGLQLLVASIYALLSKSQLLLIAVPGILHTMFANPHYTSINGTKRLNNTLSAYNYTILERRDSLTGYISVLESSNEMFRIIRCDHSLLGGEWLVTPQRASQGQTKRETVYSVFTMLEAVRLVEGPLQETSDSDKSALFIGLGIGTSPRAFINHGINTTVVELDPTVYSYAMKYFDLPPPPQHHAVITDAVPFVANAAESQPTSFDFIIHDVFTGGAEPTALFTLEFLQGLHTLLKDDGVLAINYAGDITMPPPRIILNTIHAVFPSCRIYRDTRPEESSTTFLNMVVFCVKSSGPITFRKPVARDWLGSLSRKEFVPPPKELEMRLSDVSGAGLVKADEVLKKGSEWKVEKFHPEAAKRHWAIMRTVLPAGVWENW